MLVNNFRYFVIFAVFRVIQTHDNIVIDVLDKEESESKFIPEEVIPDLYLEYQQATDAGRLDKNMIAYRRVFVNDKRYQLHVEKLKEVNGYKRHNLLIKQIDFEGNPIIYINNPVESKVPFSYLTLEEFKKVLTSKAKYRREELEKELKGKVVKSARKNIKFKTILRKNTTDNDLEANKIDDSEDTNTVNLNSTESAVKSSTESVTEYVFTTDEQTETSIDASSFAKYQDYNDTTKKRFFLDDSSLETTTETETESIFVEEKIKSSDTNGETSTELNFTNQDSINILDNSTTNRSSLTTEESVNALETLTTLKSTIATTLSITTNMFRRRPVLRRITETTTTPSTRRSLGRPFVFVG